MPLDRATLEDIQSAFLADDLPIDMERMSLWTYEEATTYFETGGETVPGAAAPAASAPALASVPATGPARPTGRLGRKPHVVCLHGTACNELILKTQLGPMLRALKDEVDFTFVEGALTVADDNAQAAGMRRFFGKDQVLREYAVATADGRGWRQYVGVAAAVNVVEEAIRALHRPVDALLGFSQGANFSTMLDARAALGLDGALPPLRCVVLMACGRPGWAAQEPSWFASPIGTPAFVATTEDDDVAATGPDEVAKLYTKPSFVVHSGPGHRPLPRDREDSEALVKQLREFIQRHCPR